MFVLGADGVAGTAGVSAGVLGVDPAEPLSDCGLQPNTATVAINIRMADLIFIVLLLLVIFGLSAVSVRSVLTSPSTEAKA